MKFMSLIFIILSLFGSVSEAAVCITDISPASIVSTNYSQPKLLNYDLFSEEAQVYTAALSCKDVDTLSNSMIAVSLVMQSAALGMACTGIGLPATVYLEGGVIILSAASLWVSSLNCEDPDSEQKMKKLIKEAVCEEMEAQGVKCSINEPTVVES